MPELQILEPEALAHKAVDILAEHQATDIALLDISRSATFTDFFIIATAHSRPQFNALTEYLEKGLKESGSDIRRKEGTAESGWVLIDFGAIIVHLFTEEQREYYRLEELWGRTTQVIRFAG